MHTITTEVTLSTATQTVQLQLRKAFMTR